MLLFITGATGGIGRRLVLHRLEQGDRVKVLSRDPQRAARLFAADANPNVVVVGGDPLSRGPWQNEIAGCDAVINLAGAGVMDRRWNPEYKKEIIASRIESTHHIVEAIAGAGQRPGVLINASAIGYYGDHGDAIIDEETPPPPPGSDFFADLCAAWEGEASRAREHGVRVVPVRISVVLDERGGALPRLMGIMRWFLGGRMGSGRQYMPWIHRRDLVGMFALALREASLDAPINAASPNPVTNREFMQTLGSVMRRPAWLPAPRFGLRLALGEAAKYVTMSQRVVPSRPLEHGFYFMYPALEDALRAIVEEGQDNERGRKWDGAPPRAAALTPEQMFDGGSTAPVNGAVDSVAAPARRPRREHPAARIKVIAIDVDGTMLRSDGRLPQGVIDACRTAARTGVTIVPATARPPRSMQSILQTLGVEGPTINYNGAVIWNPAERRAQYHEALAPALVREIIDRARSILEEVVVSVEILDRWFTDRVDPDLHTETSRAFDPDYIGSLDSFLDQPVTKLMLLAEQSRLMPVLEMVRETYWSQRQVSMFVTDPHIIQIAHPLVDKGIALQRIAKKAGASRDEVMAIGDGPNDAGMIEWAGFSVAVENACDTVRALADQVVPSNDELGVAKAIQRFVLR